MINFEDAHTIKSSSPNLVLRLLFFFIRQWRSISFDVEPHFPPEALYCWKKRVSSASTYLEYGGGSNTRCALEIAPKAVITVDSDKKVIQALRQLTCSEKNPYFLPVHAPIGCTAQNSKPLFQWPRWSWLRYPFAPFSTLATHNLMPDVVLINGCFRVASTLAMLLYTFKHKTIFLIEDFRDRPEYGVLLEYLEPIALHDRLLEAHIRQDIQTHHIVLGLLKYSTDVR